MYVASRISRFVTWLFSLQIFDIVYKYNSHITEVKQINETCM